MRIGLSPNPHIFQGEIVINTKGLYEYIVYKEARELYRNGETVKADKLLNELKLRNKE